MSLGHSGTSLRSLVAGIVRTLENLGVGTSFKLVSAEVEIPFSGRVDQDGGLGDSLNFQDVAVRGGQLLRPQADLWRLRIKLDEGRAAMVRVDRYETAIVS